MASQQEKTIAMWLHLSQFAGVLIPFAGLIIPIVLWAMNKDKMPYVNREGYVFFNALISYIIYGVICAILMLVLIGIVLAIILGVIAIVEVIRAAMRTNRGEPARNYLLAINFFKI